MNLFLESQNVHQLERRRKAVRRWRRRVERISLVICAWCGGIGLLFGGYLAVTMLPLFAVQSIVVHGELAVLTPDRVRALSGVTTGTNLFRVDVAAVQKQLRIDPWVGEVAVRRKLPNAIWIYVAERRPTALLNLQGLYLVDEVGVIFKSWEPTDPADLPVLSGVTKVTVDDDGLGFSPQVAALVRFKEVLERMPMAETLGCSELMMDRYGRLAVLTEQPMLYIRFGEVPDARQLERLHAVLPVIMQHGDAVATVDLSIDRKVIVKYGS